jgi:hypothetical protein
MSHQRNTSGPPMSEAPHLSSGMSVPARKARNSCESSAAAAADDEISTVRDGMEQLLKSGGVECPVNGVIPKPLNRADIIDTDLDVGSVVEFDINSQTHYGVIRWIGYLTDKNCVIAGIELVCEFSMLPASER